MADNVIIGVVVGVCLFLAGVFAKDKVQKRAQVRETVTDAKAAETEGAAHAREHYDAQMEQVREDAAREVADRPRTDDPLADLADRRERHAELVRRRAERRKLQSR